jgi:hypothetical protein
MWRLVTGPRPGSGLRGTLRGTPALAAGVTDRLWEVSDLVALLEAEETGGSKNHVIRAHKRYDFGMRLLVRLSVVLCLSSTLSFACSCSPPITAGMASLNADVVFRGTIAALRDVEEVSPNGGARYTKRIAVFRVSRVWKGRVGRLLK